MTNRLGTNITSVVVLGLLWEIAGRAADSVLIPPLSKIGSAWVRLLASGKLLDNLMMSLGTLAVGFFLAVLIGVLLGLLMGRFREVEHFL
ncbi:MAG TPA: ABC transporter permease, partial [Candidatus Binatia bacterium]|nr:ABC transporter permease [Candidatus Binatia bacterium]